RARRISLRVERVETDDVRDDTPFGQLVDWRRIRVILAEQVDADLDRLQDRIIERLELEAFIFAVYEDVRRSVVRLRGADQVVAGWRADHDVAAALFERGIHRVPDEAAPLPPPDVADLRAEVFGDDLGDLVLEAFLLLVRERKVLRVGADAELLHVYAEGTRR